MIRRSVFVVAVCESLSKIARDWEAGESRGHPGGCSALFSREEAKSLGNCESLAVSGAVVMYVGNLETYQGIDLLLESFRIAMAGTAGTIS